MPTRRLLLAATPALLALPRLARAQAGGSSAVDPAQASEFIRRTADELIAVIDGPGPESQKEARLQQIVDRAVDVNGVARFCLGRFWRLATPAQQQEYLQLFRTVLMKSIVGRIGEYHNVRVTIGRADLREDGTEVTTTVTRPNNAPATVVWVVNLVGGAPRIVDVVAEGTSLRLTQRSDYASYLSRNGNDVGALIAALRQQAAG